MSLLPSHPPPVTSSPLLTSLLVAHHSPLLSWHSRPRLWLLLPCLGPQIRARLGEPNLCAKHCVYNDLTIPHSRTV